MAETGKKLHLEIITPDASVLSEDVDFVLVRALDGDLGVMLFTSRDAHHYDRSSPPCVFGRSIMK